MGLCIVIILLIHKQADMSHKFHSIPTTRRCRDWKCVRWKKVLGGGGIKVFQVDKKGGKIYLAEDNIFS